MGQLTDGRAHLLAIATLGQGSCKGYWFLGSNLLVTTNKASRGRTTGAVTRYVGSAGPASTTLGLPASGSSDRTKSSHHLELAGTVRPAGAAAATVTVVQDMTNTATDAALDVASDWTWDSSTSRTTGAATVTSSQHSTYQLLRTGPTWSLTDNQDTAAAGRTTSLRDTMTTAGPVLGVTGVVGASRESWQYFTSDGYCLDHELAAAVQNTVVDTVGRTCGGPAGLPAPVGTRDRIRPTAS